MDLNALKEKIIDAVEQLEEDTVLSLSEQALRNGMEPLALLETVNEGMHRVGKLYENKAYFIADLIMAGIIFKEVLGLEGMKKQFQKNMQKQIGRVVLGTVRGDLHDIGKDIFRGMMETNMFEVIDLGVDVPAETFVKKVIELKPDILALSGILTYTTDSMKEVVEALKEAGVRDQVKVIIGGGHLTPETCAYIGADGYATDASGGVRQCVHWINNEEQVKS